MFSTDDVGLNFEDFLDMFSVLSEHAPWDLKASYAFRIYDFNNDNDISEDDIKQTIRALTGIYCLTVCSAARSFIPLVIFPFSSLWAGDRLAEDRQDAIATRVITESDVLNDGKLSYSEFEHVVLRSPDFLTLFHITI